MATKQTATPQGHSFLHGPITALIGNVPSSSSVRSSDTMQARSRLAVALFELVDAIMESDIDVVTCDVAPGSPLDKRLAILMEDNPAFCTMLSKYVCPSPPPAKATPADEEEEEGIDPGEPVEREREAGFLDRTLSTADDFGAYVPLGQFVGFLETLPPQVILSKGRTVDFTLLTFGRNETGMVQTAQHAGAVRSMSTLNDAGVSATKVGIVAAHVRERLASMGAFNCIDVTGQRVAAADLLAVLRTVLAYDGGVHANDAMRVDSFRMLHGATLKLHKTVWPTVQFPHTRFNPLCAVSAPERPTDPFGSNPDKQIDTAVAFAAQCVALGMDTSVVLDALLRALPKTDCQRVYLLRMGRNLFTHDQACDEMGGAHVLGLARGVFKSVEPAGDRPAPSTVVAIIETDIGVETLRAIRARHPDDRGFAHQMAALSIASPAQWPFD